MRTKGHCLGSLFLFYLYMCMFVCGSELQAIVSRPKCVLRTELRSLEEQCLFLYFWL